MKAVRTLGSWTSYILANDTGVAGDGEFHPHDDDRLRLTELGQQAPEIMPVEPEVKIV